jgi:hypothetical protein
MPRITTRKLARRTSKAFKRKKTVASVTKGDSYANPVIEHKWNRDMSMKEFANLSYCLIKYIENRNLEQSVGGEPWVRYQKDGEDLDTEPTYDEIEAS